MRSLAKTVVIGVLFVPAVALRALSGILGRCFCLAWAKAQLGWHAVPADNQILGLIDVEGTRRIRLGHACRIYKRVRLETRDVGAITMGDHVVLSPGVLIVARQRVAIGDYAMLGEYVSVRDQNHNMAGLSVVREAGYEASAITIGRDVWIGRGCAVLKGVTIGDGAVIGANSVVTQNVPAGQVWVGAPARFLRDRRAGESPDKALSETIPASG